VVVDVMNQIKQAGIESVSVLVKKG
jgi:biopolymer transport protein ExbD